MCVCAGGGGGGGWKGAFQSVDKTRHCDNVLNDIVSPRQAAEKVGRSDRL